MKNFLLIFLLTLNLVLFPKQEKDKLAPKVQNPDLIFQQIIDSKYSEPELKINKLKIALAISNKNKNHLQKAKALLYLGELYRQIGENDSSYLFLTESISILDSITFDTLKIDVLNSLGITCRILGRYIEGLEYLNRALNISKELNLTQKIPVIYNSLGVVYRNIGLNERAIECYQEAIKLSKEVNNNTELAQAYQNIGTVYWFWNNYNKALEYYLLALNTTPAKSDNGDFIAGLYNNIGNVHRKLKNYNEALKYYSTAEQITKEINDKNTLIVIYKNYGITYKELKDYKTALDYLNKAFVLVSHSNLRRFKLEIMNQLSDVYEKVGNLNQSLFFLKNSIALRDSLFAEENQVKINELKIKYDIEKKENLIKEVELSKKTNLEFFLILLSILLLTIIFILYTLYRQKKKIISEQTIKETLIRYVPFELCGINKDGNVIFQNELSIQKRGYLVNKNLFTLYNNDNEWFNPRTLIENKEKDLIDFEIELNENNSDSYYRQIIASLKINEKIDGYLIATIDITEQRKIAKKIESNEKLFRTYFELPLIGIAITDKERKWINFNDKLASMLGYSREELSKLKWTDLTPAESLSDEIEKEENSRKAEKKSVMNFEKQYLKKDGTLIDVRISTIAVYNDKNEIEYYVSLIDDVTEELRLQKELKNALDRAEESSRLKTTLLANMSHELRTPLNAILGFSKIIMKDSSDERTIHFSKIINQSAKRLLFTLNSILEYSQLETSAVIPVFEKYDIKNEIDEVLKDFSENAKSKGLNFLIEKSTINCYLNTDRRIFNQVLINLVDNAIKYTKSGYVKISLSEIIENDQLYLVIDVEDSGIGIEESNLEMIFEEFKQVSEGIGRSFEGSGLGLALVKKLLPLIEGTISVKSKIGLGSTFSIKLPALKETEKTPEEIFEEIINEKKLSEKESKPIGLYVEDNQMNIELAEVFLQGKCQLDSAKDGKTAIEMVKQKTYDFILMDINLGGDSIDGIKTTKIIRREKNYENTPIIALTGYAMYNDDKMIINEGFSDYLAKPFEKEQLLAILKRNKILD